MTIHHHHIKCETTFFQDVVNGNKRFEIRKNDRNYKMYDRVYLKETINGIPTGKISNALEIKYILNAKDGGQYGLCEGYCIFCW